MYDREALLALIREYGLERGEFTLASGKKSSYYLDCRKVTLDSAGANRLRKGFSSCGATICRMPLEEWRSVPTRFLLP